MKETILALPAGNAALPGSDRSTRLTTHSGILIAATMCLIVVSAALLAGFVPILFSIATVFLFAGPHNWFEARYILGRLPARTGKLFLFFLVSFLGIIGLTVSFALIPSYLRMSPAPLDYPTVYAIWNSCFVGWVALLIHWRSRTNPRFDGGWVWPSAFMLIAGIWLQPFIFSVAIIYLHPLMALVILDRELKKRYPDWRKTYHGMILLLPLSLILLWYHLRDAPALAGTDPVTQAICQHSGDWLIRGVSNHFLVAAHTFLEMVHYGIWVLVIPLLGMRSRPWILRTIPVAQRSLKWRYAVISFLLLGLLAVVVLWLAFLVDYGITRSVYFLVALVHVLAEVPFLLRVI